MTSQTCTAWTWPIALNFSHTRYFFCEGLGAKLGELEHRIQWGGPVATFSLVTKIQPWISERHWEINDC